MQLALNVIVFFLGFSIATFIALRPVKARKGIQQLSTNLRTVTDGFKAGIDPESASAFSIRNDPDSIRAGADLLLTK